MFDRYLKKVIAGVLVSLQERIFKYLELIDSGKYSHDQVEEMIRFLQEDLCVKNPETKLLEDAELILCIKSKLNRPLRVCGMVKNVGERAVARSWLSIRTGPFLCRFLKARRST